MNLKKKKHREAHSTDCEQEFPSISRLNGLFFFSFFSLKAKQNYREVKSGRAKKQGNYHLTFSFFHVQL